MSDPILERLSELLKKTEIGNKLNPAMGRVLRVLDATPKEPQAWESLPADFFGLHLPDGIKSGWLFALRSGGIFGNERHPNSWQRSLALDGMAEFEVFADDRWDRHPIGSGLANRAISIPPNVWHRIKIGDKTFVSLSFHTAETTELIEETSDGDDLSRTRQRLYHQ